LLWEEMTIRGDLNRSLYDSHRPFEKPEGNCPVGYSLTLRMPEGRGFSVQPGLLSFLRV
jgi:hypothetical protein